MGNLSQLSHTVGATAKNWVWFLRHFTSHSQWRGVTCANWANQLWQAHGRRRKKENCSLSLPPEISFTRTVLLLLFYVNAPHAAPRCCNEINMWCMFGCCLVTAAGAVSALEILGIYRESNMTNKLGFIPSCEGINKQVTRQNDISIKLIVGFLFFYRFTMELA